MNMAVVWRGGLYKAEGREEQSASSWTWLAPGSSSSPVELC